MPPGETIKNLHPHADVHAVILAGGRGTRFWPRSRRRRAKQVLSVIGADSLIQQTLQRLRTIVPPERTWVITNGYLRNEILKQLPGVPPTQVIAEPVQRNTAPAIGLAAHLIRRRSPDAVMAVFPSDHVIGKADVFLRVLEKAIAGAVGGAIVVLGIRPRWPETGYGYIQFRSKPGKGTAIKLSPVARFREKPDLATAKRFLKSGQHFWNSGMFVWKAQVILSCIDRYLPRTAAILNDIVRGEPLEKLYPQCENISIDFAVLERAPNVLGIACDIGWSDVGSWNAVYDLLPHDQAGNAVRGPAMLEETRRCYFDTSGKFVAAIGVEDLVVVDTPDALLITRRDRAQEVTRVVKRLEELRREDLL
jgi:mannose-1-phosphate guanylyltransferase